MKTEKQIMSGEYKVQTNYSRDHSQDFEYPKGQSMTVPDQSMSIPELMSRYAKGLPLGGRDVEFELDEDSDFDEGLPDLRGLDLAEIQQMKAEADEQVRIAKEKLEQIVKENNDKKAKEALAEAQYQKLKQSKKGQALLARAEQELEEKEKEEKEGLNE